MIKIDGDKIKRLRESQGLTQLYMATAVDVTTDTISRWENRRYPTIKKENGEKLAEALGVSVEDILLVEDSSDTDETSESIDQPPDDRKGIATVARKRPTAIILTLSALIVIILITTILFLHKQKSNPVIEAVRIMPSRAIPGSSFPVVIEIHHSSSRPLSIILKEFLPEGAKIVESSPTAGSGNTGNEVKWLKKIDTTARFSYLVTLNGPADKEYNFSGQVSTSSSSDNVTVGGTNSITLGQYHWADNDGDNQISDQEILTVFDYYSGIDDFTVDIEFIEKMWLGSGYTWNQENNLISISP